MRERSRWAVNNRDPSDESPLPGRHARSWSDVGCCWGWPSRALVSVCSPHTVARMLSWSGWREVVQKPSRYRLPVKPIRTTTRHPWSGCDQAEAGAHAPIARCGQRQSRREATAVKVASRDVVCRIIQAPMWTYSNICGVTNWARASWYGRAPRPMASAKLSCGGSRISPPLARRFVPRTDSVLLTPSSPRRIT
jgi:hypothetical protein